MSAARRPLITGRCAVWVGRFDGYRWSAVTVVLGVVTGGGVGGAEPSAALVAGLQGTRCSGVGDPPGAAQFGHQVLSEFSSPERGPVGPPVRDRLEWSEQGLVDAGEGVRPGRRLPV